MDPQAIVADLRRRARKLLDAAAALEETYGLSMGNPPTEQPKPEQEGTAPAARGERRAQLIKFLKEYGPKHRGDIKKWSGIPTGSISYLLKDDSTFERLEDGRWRAKGNEVMGLDHQ